ncbi:protein phosphatase 2C domain-containing protein [Streptomyces sp. NPDC005820]|uniref:protein phosphatase 2C domain-containing protein n=1 Tax=Streptomyces sp. NPDC005820 TaxID=3157069 RepID=UPI0033D040D7
MSGPAYDGGFRDAHDDRGHTAAAVDPDGLDAHIAGLPYGVMARETITRVPEAPVPPAPPAPPTPEGPQPYAEPEAEPLRGVPAHVGNRPPSYPPHPLGRPSVRDTEDALAAFSPVVLLDGAHIGRLTVRAASVRGDSHNWEGSCRQDAMTVTRIGPPEAEMLLLAVADGVGSAVYSHVGSYELSRRAAVFLDREAESIHAAVCARDENELRVLATKAVAGAAAELRAAWAQAAQHRPRPYADQDYATTLHVLLIPTDPGIRDRVLCSVGDGGLFVLREGGWEHGDPDDGAGLLDTRTEALPHAYRSVKATLVRTMPGEVLLLGTDGITNPLTQKDPEFARRLAEAWGGPEVPSLSDFLWQAQTRAKSYDDDRTVICVWEERA